MIAICRCYADFFDGEVRHVVDLFALLNDEPCLVQIKRRRKLSQAEGVSTVRELIGALMEMECLPPTRATASVLRRGPFTSRRHRQTTAIPLAFAISSASATAGTENYIAVINGGQELGPTTSSSIGNAFLTFDPASKMLCYAISFTALDFPETAAHFHGPASFREAAGVLFGINAPAGPSGGGNPKTGCVGPVWWTGARMA